MRTIPKNRLPQFHHLRSVIKAKEMNHNQRMHNCLERTLARCNEMYAEYESNTVALRENSQKEGFRVGFELLFSQLIKFLEYYEQQQKIRMHSFKNNLFSSIHDSFNDSVIVERIIHNLQVQSGQQKPLKIIIPASAKLPDGIDESNYVRTEDNHITIQNDMDSIRFPTDQICQQWITNADHSIHPISKDIDHLISLFSKMLNQFSSQFSQAFDKL